jgi:Heparinase II/III-like protein/Heparinase II/III N-terminus
MNAAASLRVAEKADPVIRVRLDPELCARPVLDGLLAGQFAALGERHMIGDPVDWQYNPSADVEWLILLNKFYHAPGLVQAWIDTRDRRYLDLWKAHLRGWIATMEPGFIAADVTGRRLQNWVFALALRQAEGSDHDPEFEALAEGSLTRQATWLRKNLHPARNHRTLELLALLLVAVWLGDEDRADWAIEALADNADADFLPDGVHVELSSHYHCLALRNLIDCVDLCSDNGIAMPKRLTERVTLATRFAHALHKPDGMIPALSDADKGDYRAMLGPPSAMSCCEVFPDGGYVILRDEAACAGDPLGQYLVFDCGALGAGNHGHLDCLSFEFAAQGRSLIVDPGRYTYFEGGPVNERAAFRGTAAHNTLQVDGREQTAYRQGPKRMKIAGPAPTVALIRADAAIVHARAHSHEVDVIHERAILRAGKAWIILDRMHCSASRDYDLRLQLSPEAQGRVNMLTLPSGLQAVYSPELLVVACASHPLTVETESAWVSPQYGIRHAAPRLKMSHHASSSWVATLLLPFVGDLPDITFECDGKRYTLRLGSDAPISGDWPC